MSRGICYWIIVFELRCGLTVGASAASGAASKVQVGSIGCWVSDCGHSDPQRSLFGSVGGIRAPLGSPKEKL